MRINGFLAAVTGGLLAVYLFSLGAVWMEGTPVTAAPGRREQGAEEGDVQKDRTDRKSREGRDSAVSGSEVEVSGNAVSGSVSSDNAVSGNGEPGSAVSENKAPGSTVSENRIDARSLLRPSALKEKRLKWDGVSWNSVSDNGVSYNGVSYNGVSCNSVSCSSVSYNSDSGKHISGNNISDNSISVHDISGKLISGNSASENMILGNRIPKNNISGNSVSGNSISENGISADSISRNNISGNSISGNNISGNILSCDDLLSPISGNGYITLAQRQKVMGSHKATLRANERDRQTISANSLDFSQLRIACLGDSITEAVNLEQMENYQELAYPSVLKQALGAQEVYNLGVGGSSIGRYWADAFVDRYEEIPEDADLILVMGGTNDGFCASLVEFGTSGERRRRTFWGDLDELMDGLKKDYPYAEVIFLTPLPNSLQDFLRKERPYLIHQEKFADTVRILAAEHGMEVIDLYNSNLLDGRDKDNALHLMPDGVHPNAEGYRILGEHIAADLIRLLEERKE